jgi:hypothetical protein
MNKKLIYVMFSTLALLMFAGCNTSGLKVNVFKNRSSSAIVADNIFAMPKDASRILLAVSAKILNSDKENSNVTFQSDYPVKLPFAELFSLDKAVLLTYDGESKALKAELFFSDTLGRTCAYSVNASYVVNDNKIVVNRYTAVEKYTAPQNAVCFIFPTKEYKKLKKNNLPQSYYDLYKYAATKAVTPRQAVKYKDKMEWTIMVFMLDRMSKSAKMVLELSKEKGSSDKGYDSFSKYLIYSGWRVGEVTGKFHLLKPDSQNPLYAKAFCSSGGGFSRRQLIGLYQLR